MSASEPAAPAERLLDGTVALVSGASSGIGAATAIALARRGARVALVARRADRLEALASRIRDGGGTALAIQCDITEAGQASGAVERAAAELGRLDTVVNNAGIMLLGPALDSDVDDWERMIALNVLGSLYVTHAALPHLLRAARDSPRQVADVTVVEPGTVDTELVSHVSDGIRQAAQSQVDSIEPLRPEDIADTILHIVTRDRRVAVNEVLIRAAEQSW